MRHPNKLQPQGFLGWGGAKISERHFCHDPKWYRLDRDLLLWSPESQPWRGRFCAPHPVRRAWKTPRRANDPRIFRTSPFLLPDEPKINDRVQAVKWIEKRWKELFEYLLNDSIIDETLVASQPQPQDVSPVVPHRVLFHDLGP